LIDRKGWIAMASRRELMAATAALSMFGAGAAQSADPVKIRLSWVAPLSSWGSILLEKKDLAVHMGQTYTLETVHFNGTPLMVTAIANGELEVAAFAFSTLPIAIENAGIDDLMVIADEIQDGAPGYYTREYRVLADGPIKTIRDLKGKVVATNVAGSAVDVTMRAMLRNNGLEDKRDYTVIETPFPTMQAMLAERKADLVTAVQPFSLAPEMQKISRTLFTGRDAVGRTQFSFFTARKSFIDRHRAAMVDFLEDTLRIVHWYLDPKNHDAVAVIAGRVTKQPPDRFGWLFTSQDDYRDPDMVPDLAALQASMQLMKDMGFVRTTVDVSKHADLSLIGEAANRLK
jgi:sulfonate transport system substrate-binding protein